MKVVGIANSKKFYVNEDGIALDNWQQLIAGGTTGTINDYVALMREKNLRNSVFADVTANADVATVYGLSLIHI